MSLIDLANRLDQLADAEAIFVTESAEVIFLADVSADVAQEIWAAVRQLGWEIRAESGADEVVGDAFSADFQPYRLTITKPLEPGRTRILTLAGFSEWLDQEPAGLLQLATSVSPFETEAFRVGDWNDVTQFEVAPRAKSPRELVKEVHQQRSVPSDIRPWLLRAEPSPPWEQVAFLVWRRAALLRMLRSIAAEVHAGSESCFYGAATLRVSDPSRVELDSIPQPQFLALQRAVAWVYESVSEAETRFRLLNYEFGRLGRSGRAGLSSLADYAPIAFEGARLAFQYSLAKVSSESAKALADLRKSLSEETARLSETTRQIVGAVAGSVFLGIGLVAARLATETPPLALFVMGLVVLGYVVFVAKSGFDQLSLQREMRTEWRKRLYGYISDEDYKAMILVPAGKAERYFTKAALIGGGIAVVMFASLCVALSR